MLSEAKFLTANENAALVEIKRRVSELFAVRHYILFGSKARGDAAADSDIDLLLVTEQELKHFERHVVAKEITRINRQFDTLYSFIVIPSAEWNSRLFSFMPLHENVVRDGIAV